MMNHITSKTFDFEYYSFENCKQDFTTKTFFEFFHFFRNKFQIFFAFSRKMKRAKNGQVYSSPQDSRGRKYIRRATHTFATLCAHVLEVIHVLDVIKEFHFVESLLAVFYYISK